MITKPMGEFGKNRDPCSKLDKLDSYQNCTPPWVHDSEHKERRPGRTGDWRPHEQAALGHQCFAALDAF